MDSRCASGIPTPSSTTSMHRSALLSPQGTSESKTSMCSPSLCRIAFLMRLVSDCLNPFKGSRVLEFTGQSLLYLSSIPDSAAIETNGVTISLNCCSKSTVTISDSRPLPIRATRLISSTRESVWFTCSEICLISALLPC